MSDRITLWLAVFCDGSSHSRRERKSKDAAINSKLQAMGIRPVRILGSEIKFGLTTDERGDISLLEKGARI